MIQSRKLIVVIAALFTIYASAHAATHAKVQTSMGDIIVELFSEQAPGAVENFLAYATSGHYDRTLFHRVVKGYVIQGGGYSRLYTERVMRDPIAYEGDKGLKNERGAIAMARGDDPDSAQAQWFINLRNNEKFDHRVTDLGPIYGYAVFGRVVDGMGVADAIGEVATGEAGPFDEDVPLEQIFILRVDPVDWPVPE